ncbi:MAG: DUF1631 family protein [Rubrivivax sp.]|nr:DUF1631 family protein [Rubrivivax sp.]
MAPRNDTSQLAGQARRLYTEELVKGLVGLVQTVLDEARSLLDKPSEHSAMMRRRDLVQSLLTGAQAWHRDIVGGLRNALLHGVSASRVGELPHASVGSSPMSLVDDATIELEIVTSRLALAIMDRASWEFADLRSRVAALERRAELEATDLLRAHVLARIAFDAWCSAGQTLEGWRELQPVLHEEFALLVEEAYHEVNRWLMSQQVLPEVDLRPFIRRTRSHPQAMPQATPQPGWQPSASPGDGGAGGRGGAPDQRGSSSSAEAGHSGVGEETRMLTRSAPLARGPGHAQAVLGRLNQLVGRHLPRFAQTSGSQGLSSALAKAIDTVQADIRQRVTPSTQRGAGPALTTPALLEDLQQRKRALKKAAASPEERATIEIVALMFQSLLTEERIPAAVRVWFARLQMPVLRVAVSEPDFFATVDHPTRRLIDRMGACVLGFDSGTLAVDEELEKEIKRIVRSSRPTRTPGGGSSRPC